MTAGSMRNPGQRPAVAAAILVVLWAGVVFVIPQIRFVVFAPEAKTGFEVSLALLRLFAAFVFFRFPDDRGRDRLRWIALGLAIQGFGGIGFGYLLPLLRSGDELNPAMYESLLTRMLSTTAMAVGLMPRHAIGLTTGLAVRLLGGFVALGLVVVLIGDHLPNLTTLYTLETATESVTVLDGLTGWHWVLSLFPIGAAVIAAIGAARNYPGNSPAGWLTVAMVLMAGAQLHTLFWPSAFSPILTTASLLRLAYTMVLAAGGVIELNRLATERAVLLAFHQETANRHADLMRLRANFSAMIAHELTSPLGAIRRATELLTTDPLPPSQARAVETIESQVGLLDTLVADAQTTAIAERDEFVVRPVPIELNPILADASAFARTLPGDHPVSFEPDGRPRVFADPERISQVLHNLLGNAAKFSPPGTPIALSVTQADGRVRILVTDSGPGIEPEDLPRIFERYGRGRDTVTQRTPGTGLGLYLSRQIVSAHGSDIHVASVPGSGATFWFELEVAP